MRDMIRFSVLAACFGAVLSMSSAQAQLAPNQTKGFGNSRMVTFTYTYTQNFACVDQPLLDLDFNGIPADTDPNEMQLPKVEFP